MISKNIASAVQKGSNVYVYNEQGCSLFYKQGTLIGFTATTVTIKRGDYIECYNNKGSKLFQRCDKNNLDVSV